MVGAESGDGGGGGGCCCAGGGGGASIGLHILWGRGIHIRIVH